MEARMLLLSVAVVLQVALPSWGLPSSATAKYSGWRVVRVAPSGNATHLYDDLYDLEHPLSMQVLDVVQDGADVAVAPSYLAHLEDILQDQATLTVTAEDLATQLREQGPVLRVPLPPGTDTFDRFMTQQEIAERVEALPLQHRDVEVLVAGTTSQGRPIHKVVIKGPNRNMNKQVIIVDGGMHAREWASPASVLYLINRLLETPELLQNLEWHIFPLLNPDGYHFTWTDDRLWRKNRRNTGHRSCIGVDLNRNFGEHWGHAGASSSKCSNIFMGPQPFSEEESKVLRKAIKDVKGRLGAYVSVHAYGQVVLYPWGYSAQEKPANVDELHEVGQGMADLIRQRTGASYRPGNSAGIFYPASGASDDYALSQGAGVSYTIEVRDEGRYGFVLPASQIKQTAEDVWSAFQYLGKYVQSKYRLRESPEDTKDSTRPLAGPPVVLVQPATAPLLPIIPPYPVVPAAPLWFSYPSVPSKKR